MKKLFKVLMVAIPALVVAAAVGMTTIGCGDDTTTPPTSDIGVKVGADMVKTGPGADMAKGHD